MKSVLFVLFINAFIHYATTRLRRCISKWKFSIFTQKETNSLSQLVVFWYYQFVFSNNKTFFDDNATLLISNFN